ARYMRLRPRQWNFWQSTTWLHRPALQPCTTKPLGDPRDPKFHQSVKFHQRQLLACTGGIAWPRFPEVTNVYTGKLSQYLAKLDTSVMFHLTDCPSGSVLEHLAPSDMTAEHQAGFTDQLDLLLFPEAVRIRGVTVDHFPTLGRYLNQPRIDTSLLRSLLTTVPTDHGYCSFSESTSLPMFSPESLELLPKQHYVMVCTHGSRDCRCREMGEPTYQAIANEIQQRGWSDRWQALRVSHVGGHIYAANAIHSPSGDWYGLLKPAGVPSFVTALDAGQVLWRHWRGRTGLSTLEQADEYSRHTQSVAAVPRQCESLATASAVTSTPQIVNLTFRLPNGVHKYVQVTLDAEQQANPPTLMQVAKAHGIELEATCGGQCECATCHMIVENYDAFQSQLLPVSDAEEDMLEYAIGRQDHSRLSCQISVTPAIDGLCLLVPM
ncbi:hypothetical protein H4R35_005678, partial [Dimargaris xerosporica]